MAARKRNDLACAFCKRLFAKPEHLKRHEQTHSRQRSHICTYCARDFAREDSLKRHVKTHHGRLSSPGTHSLDANGRTAIQSPLIQQGLPSHSQQQQAAIVQDGLLVLAEASASQAFDDHATTDASISHINDFGDLTTCQDDMSNVGFDDLLSLLLNENITWPANDSDLPMASADNAFGEDLHPPDDQQSSQRAHQAMIQMSDMIKDLSSSLVQEVQYTGITSEFLDTCLHTFFDRFCSILPVMHQPTFSLRDCAHPLLLNMIALGSLFIAADREQALVRGEALWRLAHTAVATSWQSMLQNASAQGDIHRPVQLVLTALLGQTYAVLSRSQPSRLTSHMFHSLGFYWARYAGMLVRDPFIDIPAASAPAEIKISRWRLWCKQEIRHRAILGHYVLDGLLSQISGLPTSARHLANSMILPSSDAAFAATSAEQWIEAMNAQPQTSITFGDVYEGLFADPPMLNIQLSSFTIRVVLEAFQSLISDHHEAGGAIVGSPSHSAICRALLYLLQHQIQTLPREQMVDLTVRWHMINMELCVNTYQFIKVLCDSQGISQQLCMAAGAGYKFSIDEWSNSNKARRAVLHCTALIDLISGLSFRQMQSIHVPLAMFSSATLFIALHMSGKTRLTVPSLIDWPQVVAMPSNHIGTGSIPARAAPEPFRLDHDCWQSGPKSKRLLYYVNMPQSVLESLGQNWGIAKEMERVVQDLLALCGRANPRR
ncbi:hypothetical protein K461DRAFT_164024 [Myriangium duriaei CBS 260.36]|uniref:C2H2-type domain-containing protein n=1 Tax=Myriangium duriaei CBS 260.36 TaxID=1168546 RepID=A0A9P4IVY9_9PEZI|nr:hypothetical protein K461DRAFT_164024 [Myriangium duriaei CBS 260.36]